jgi:hypothetical protein
MSAIQQGSEVVAHATARTCEVRGHRIGRLVDWAPGHGPVVDYPGSPRAPLVARSLVALDAQSVVRAREAQREVLLTFEGERSDRPIVLGLL